MKKHEEALWGPDISTTFDITLHDTTLLFI